MPTEKTLRVLTRDVVNPRKRDRRMTRDWTHDEVIKAGTRLVLDPAWSNGEHSGPATLRKIGEHDRCADASWLDSAPLFAALMDASTEVPADSLGALLVRFDYAGRHALDEVIAVLLQTGRLQRTHLFEALRYVEETAQHEADHPAAKAHAIIVKAESI